MSEAQKYQQLRRELKKQVRFSQKRAGELQRKLREYLKVPSLNSAEIFAAMYDGKIDQWSKWMVKYYFEYTADVAKYSILLRDF